MNASSLNSCFYSVKRVVGLIVFILMFLGLISLPSAQADVIKINEAIYQAVGRGPVNSNTFIITTAEGNVIVDTSGPWIAAKHLVELKDVNNGPVRYIVLTHGHGDHRGGVRFWKGKDTEVIVQKNYIEFLHYIKRFEGYFQRMNLAQFGGSIVTHAAPSLGNYAAEIDATIFYLDRYDFKVGDIDFKLLHSPGETYDHTTVWVPKYKAAFIGDNYYESFPNLYTLRGTKPRWALDYVESLNKILALEPEILLPSHGQPIQGHEEIAKILSNYRDAILHVHDQTVQGMNEGKDVYTLMREVKLPASSEIREGYGKVAWSVRGIYEGYMGWFHGNPASMYDQATSSVYPELVEMVGGADKVADRAGKLVEQGQLVQALHLTDIALVADQKNQKALEVRLEAFNQLKMKMETGSRPNLIERGWLTYGINDTKKKLEEIEELKVGQPKH